MSHSNDVPLENLVQQLETLAETYLPAARQLQDSIASRAVSYLLNEVEILSKLEGRWELDEYGDFWGLEENGYDLNGEVPQFRLKFKTDSPIFENLPDYLQKYMKDRRVEFLYSDSPHDISIADWKMDVIGTDEQVRDFVEKYGIDLRKRLDSYIEIHKDNVEYYARLLELEQKRYWRWIEARRFFMRTERKYYG